MEQELIAILLKLVNFNTVNDLENNEIMNFLADFFQKLDFKIEYITNSETGKKNLLAFYDNQALDTLYFCGHTDTVPAGSNWTKNPFELTKTDDKLFGLGTADMKGGIAAFMQTLKYFDLKSLNINIGVILTYSEETDFQGIKDVIASNKVPTDKVIIAEPTDLVPVTACKGATALTIEFIGKEAHGSTPALGDNAILKAVNFINNIKNYFATLETEQNPIFNPPFTTLNIAKITGGDAINKVPAKCTLSFEFRSAIPRQSEKIIKKITDIATEEKGITIKNTLSKQPMILPKTDFIKKIETLTGQKTKGENYITEASLLFEAGFEPVILGPGPMNAHIADEYVNLASLIKTVKIYSDIIKELTNISMP